MIRGIREIAVRLLVDWPIFWALVLSGLLFSFNKICGSDEVSRTLSSSINVVLTIASIATGYLSTCKSILVTRIDEPWLNAIDEERPERRFREEIVGAFSSGIYWSFWVIALCIFLTVAGVGLLDRLTLKVVLPLAGICFSGLQLLYVTSVGFFLVYAFRAAVVFNGFALEICIHLRKKAAARKDAR